MRGTTMSSASRKFGHYNPSEHESTENHQFYIQQGQEILESMMIGIDPNCEISPESQMLALQYQRGNLPNR